MRVCIVVAFALSGTAHADDAPPALIVHVPPMTSRAGAPIELAAMLDAPAATLSVRWRPVIAVDPAARSWQDVAFERSSAGGWFAALPSPLGGVEYYIVGRSETGSEVAHFASSEAPHTVRVDPTMVDQLETLDRDRLRDRRNQIAIDVMGHDFGNRFDLDDRFVRAELGFTHRLLRTIHHVSFGFGSISGTTPVVSAAEDGRAQGKALRYGFGEIRIRAHRSIFIDARASLGVSHDGFDQGIRGVVTFGKPWRSSLSFGGELLRDLGASAWVRLQWDSARPFLMGASIVRTDLPGAVIDAAGLYLGYDVAYRLAERFTVRAQLSYGSRDGAAHFGGGLGTALDF